MQALPERYREALTRHVHSICWNRNLDSQSMINTEADCRIERLLPNLVALAKLVGPGDYATFESALPSTICVTCGNQDMSGDCRVREEAECCLYRYLPLVYDAIHSVDEAPSDREHQQ